MDPEIQKQLNVSRTFTIAMKLIQDAINSRDDKTQQQAYLDEFISLLDDAKSDMDSTSVVKGERVIYIMDVVNKERSKLLMDKAKAEQNNMPETVKSYEKLINLSLQACAYVSTCYKQDKTPLVLPIQTFPIQKRVVHEEIPLNTVALNIKNQDLPKISNVSYKLTIAFPSAEDIIFEQKFSSGPIDISTTVTGFSTANPTSLKAKRIYVKILKTKKKLLGSSVKPVAEIELPFREFQNKTTFEKKFGVKVIDNKSPFNFFITGKMRTPFVNPEIYEEDVSIHTAPSGEEIATATMMVNQGNRIPSAAPSQTGQKLKQLTSMMNNNKSSNQASPKPQQKKQQLTDEEKEAREEAALMKLAMAKPKKRERPKVDIPPIYILQDWEYERFIGMAALEQLKVQSDMYISLSKTQNQPVPPEVTKQNERVTKLYNDMMEKLTNGAITGPQYLEMLEKSIEEDSKKLNEMPDTPEKAQFQYRFDMTMNEVQQMRENLG